MVSIFRIAAVLGLLASSVSAAGAAEVTAKSLVLPGQANAGATLLATAEVRVVGDLAGAALQCDIILAGNATIDGTDPILGSAVVPGDGFHAISITLPPETLPGIQQIALRVVPLDDEINRTDNIVFASPLTVLAPHVTFASTAPLLFQATALDPDLAADLAITNDGTPGSYGFYDVASAQPVSWLELAPNSGVAVGGGAPGLVAVLIHPQGLIPGTYETSILLWSQSSFHVVQTLPVKLVIAAPWFVPGDRIRTTLAPETARELRFETLAGMKLTVSALTLNTTPKKGAHVEILVRPVLFDPLAPISLPQKTLKALKKKATFKTPTSGPYLLRLFNPGATELTVEVQTGRALPKTAGPQVVALREKVPAATVLLLPGATLDADFHANAFVSGPIDVAAECAAGVLTGIGQYVVQSAPNAFILNGLAIPSGSYVTLEAQGFGPHKKAKIKVAFSPHQPPLGTALIDLD